MKCNGDPDPGNLLVSTLRPDREDLVRKWARPRLSRVVSCAQCYRRRALSFASQRRRGQLWNVRRHAAASSSQYHAKASSQAPKRVRNRISLCLLQSAHGPMYLAVSRAHHAFRVGGVVKDALLHLEMVHPFEEGSSAGDALLVCSAACI